MFSPVTQDEGQNLFPEPEDLKTSYEARHEALETVLEQYATHTRMSIADVTYPCKTLLRKDGVTVMRLANVKTNRRELKFEHLDEPDEPSCLIIIDNRPDGGQTVCIQQYRKSFYRTDMAAHVLEEAFNAGLLKYRLRMGIKAKYSTESFWKTVAGHVKGIVRVDFHFPYPNMPEISDRIRAFEEIAKETNSEPTLSLMGQHGENLLLSPDCAFVVRAIEACAASGKPILITPRGKRKRVKIDVLNVVSEELSDAVFQNLDRPDLFDSHYTLILEFLKNIRLVYDA